jgi:hypothetical protein
VGVTKRATHMVLVLTRLNESLCRDDEKYGSEGVAAGFPRGVQSTRGIGRVYSYLLNLLGGVKVYVRGRQGRVKIQKGKWADNYLT